MLSSRFPFGKPVTACKPSADGPRRLFVLGAYPSALHVRWVPPKPFQPIAAIAVDNEPEPFWTGHDEAAHFEKWMSAVEWNPEWGDLTQVGRLNGSSGRWVDEQVLAPLQTSRPETWISDCLDTYRCSVDLAARLKDTYQPFATNMKVLQHSLARHPSEDDIVKEALGKHRQRLLRELDTARPELVVSLGNAALRVLADIVQIVGSEAPKKLAVKDYGRRFTIKIGDRTAEWLPLAHPAAPKPYQRAHRDWAAAQREDRPQTLHLDDNLLDSWLERRLGYGTVPPLAWFLGIEESCDSPDEVSERLKGEYLEDNRRAHERLSPRFDALFRARSPSLQPTWRPLIRAWMIAKGESPEDQELLEKMRTYQRDHWGSSSGEVLLSEVLPLPSPRNDEWFYSETARHPELAERAQYEEMWLPRRVEYLAKCRREMKPRVAIGYGREHWPEYARVFGADLDKLGPLKDCKHTWRVGWGDTGAVALVDHPVARGIENADWDLLGHWMRAVVRAA